MRYSSFVEFHKKTKNFGKYDKKEKEIESSVKIGAPETRVSVAINELTAALEIEILDNVKSVHPKNFEQIVIDLMETMGYGIGEVTPYSVGGGIDGIVNEDELGLDKIYLQAKRYTDAKVNEKEMRDFIGALETHSAHPINKGVFITTSFFSEKAITLAESSKHHVIRLVDGDELAKLMIKYNLGVQIKKGYEIKEINGSFFEDEI